MNSRHAWFALPLLLMADRSAHALEDVPVYGTISVSRFYNPPDKIEEFAKDHPYHPGRKITTETKHWTITVRYLPNKRRVSTVVHRYHHYEERKTDRTDRCQGRGGEYDAAGHDYETMDKTGFVAGTKETSGNLSLFVQADGSYKFVVPSVSAPAPKGETVVRIRDMLFGCLPEKASVTRTSSSSTATVGSNFGEVKTKVDKMPADVFASKDAYPVPQSDGSIAMVTWNLTRAVPKVIARITAPATFRRGDVVTLDGKASEGRITEYRWRFDVDPRSCKGSVVNAAQEWTGPEVKFQALCDFTAHLEVKDETNVKARDATSVLVQARDGIPWQAHYTPAAPGKPITAVKITTVAQPLGMNRCGYKSHPDDSNEADHIIHSKAKNSQTWFDDGYLIGEVKDKGPFNGMFYVSTQMLDIFRVERVNADLLTGGAVALLNAEWKSSGAADLLTQVTAHEKMHSTLMKEAYDRLGEDEPARAIEKVTGGTKDSVQTDADMKIRGAQTVMAEASAEAKVQERLRGMGFTKDIVIWLPPPKDIGGSPQKKNLGPGWTIGDSAK